MILLENRPTGKACRLDEMESHLRRPPEADHPFRPTGDERSNLTDE